MIIVAGIILSALGLTKYQKQKERAEAAEQGMKKFVDYQGNVKTIEKERKDDEKKSVSDIAHSLNDLYK